VRHSPSLRWAPFLSCRAFHLITLFCLVTSVLATTTLTFAQTLAGSNWEHLKALPQHTRLHVSADKMSHTCYLLSVDDTSLVCGRYTFPRAEVKTVKLTRYGTSYGIGTAIGAGAGAGIGVAVVSGDGFFSNDKGKAAGIGLILGAGVGALVAGPGDLFRGPTVYRR
jgi:hypothetical protein